MYGHLLVEFGHLILRDFIINLKHYRYFCWWFSWWWWRWKASAKT